MGRRISLAMIVKNEAANLPDCLAGVSGLVDEVIVVDTGSTDGTPEVAAKLGAVVANFPWTDDFAAARNESWRLATGEWILWLDADDRIDGRSRALLADLLAKLEQIDPSRSSVFLMSCRSKVGGEKTTDCCTHIRLMPNRPDLTWEGRVYERLNFAGDACNLKQVATQIVIEHKGYQDPAEYAAKRFRNMRLLEKEYLADPDNLCTLFYLGRILHWQGRTNEAIRFLQRSIEQDVHGNHPTTLQAYSLVADCHIKINRPAAALRTVEEGISRFRDYIPLLYQQGCLLDSMNRFAEAEAVFRKIVTISPQAWAIAGEWPEFQGEKSRLMLGRLRQRQGQLAEAEMEYRLALSHNQHSTAAWFLLGQVKVRQERLQDAEQIAARLQQCPESEYEYALMRGQICVLTQRLAEAKQWIDRAIAARPADVTAYVVLGGLLYCEGTDWQHCLEVHAKVVAMDPSQVEVRRRLEQLRARLIQPVTPTLLGEAHTHQAVHPAVAQRADLGAACGLAFSC